MSAIATTRLGEQEHGDIPRLTGKLDDIASRGANGSRLPPCYWFEFQPEATS